MAKAAILYADEVELISPSAALMASLSAIAAGQDADLLDILLDLDDETIAHLGGASSLAPEWRENLRAIRSLPRAALRGLAVDHPIRLLRGQLDAMLAASTSQLRESTERQLTESGMAELLPAFEAGVVYLSPSGISEDVSTSDQFAEAALAILAGLLMDPTSHVILDATASRLASRLVETGELRPDDLALRHAGEAAVGTGLVARLPAFVDPPVTELLDLRRDLSGPLMRYRSASMRMASTLAHESFDPRSGVEIDDLWRREVAPALADIKDGLADHGLIREMAKSTFKDVTTLLTGAAGPALYIGMGAFTADDSMIATAAAIATPGVAAMQAMGRGAMESGQQRRQIRRHELYYLYEAGRRIS